MSIFLVRSVGNLPRGSCEWPARGLGWDSTALEPLRNTVFLAPAHTEDR